MLRARCSGASHQVIERRSSYLTCARLRPRQRLQCRLARQNGSMMLAGTANLTRKRGFRSVKQPAIYLLPSALLAHRHSEEKIGGPLLGRAPAPGFGPQSPAVSKVRMERLGRSGRMLFPMALWPVPHSPHGGFSVVCKLPRLSWNSSYVHGAPNMPGPCGAQVSIVTGLVTTRPL